VDVSGIVGPTWAVAGEFGGVYKSVEGVTVHEYNYQAGVRYFSRANPRWTPFGQALVGRTTAGGSGLDSVSAFSLQLGGGLNGSVTRSLWVRVGVDYRRVFFPRVRAAAVKTTFESQSAWSFRCSGNPPVRRSAIRSGARPADRHVPHDGRAGNLRSPTQPA
jgi:hypothetical protein